MLCEKCCERKKTLARVLKDVVDGEAEALHFSLLTLLGF